MMNQSKRATDASPTADNWDQHWSEFAASSEIGPATEYRRRVVRNLLGIQGDGTGVRLLDIGSGTGAFAEQLLAEFPGLEYLGLELSAFGVETARKRAPRGRFLQRNLLVDPTPQEIVDFQATHAMCSEVLEHIDDPVLLLQNASRYMAKHCKLVVTVPGGPMSAFDKHIGHRQHFTPASLSKVMVGAHFETERVNGVGFPFFNIYKQLVILRGDKVLSEVTGSEPSLTVRLGTIIFGTLFRLNSMSSGWQMVGIGRLKG